nr:cytochrome P450 CYP72A219-like [Tanacetum cinerariifolium]
YSDYHTNQQFGPKPRVFIKDPELIKDISSRPGEFQRPQHEQLKDSIIGGLAASEGEKWTKHRHIINPAFHLESIKNMFSTICLSCNNMVDKWALLTAESGGVEVDVWPYIDNLAGDVLSRAAFSSLYQREQTRSFKETATSFKLWRGTKAREEIMQAFGLGELHFEGLKHLKIVTMILNEVLRLYPPAAMVLRATHKDTKLGNMTIPSGVHIIIPIIHVQHDHDICGDDAREFKPERFLGVANATKGRGSASFCHLVLGRGFALGKTLP